MKRSKLKRRKPLRRRPKSADEYARQYHSLERVFFVSVALNCVVTWCESALLRRYREGHHIRSGGMGKKAGYKSIVPLCPHHHRWLHKHGRTSFERAFAVDLDLEAQRTEESWQQHGERYVKDAKANGRFQAWEERQ